MNSDLPKIDLPHAEPERVAAQMSSVFGINESETINISAKTGVGVDKVLKAIIDRIPHPTGDDSTNLKALLFDSS